MKQTLSQRCTIEDALAVLYRLQNENLFLCFAEYLFYDDEKVSRNAAWILTHANDHELLQIAPLYDRLVDLVLQTSNTPLKRLTLNILQRLPTTRDRIRTDFLDFCLEHMVSPVETPGVQALCMKIAYQLCQFYPELQAEFRCIIENMETTYYTPAVTSVRKNLLKTKKRV